MALFKAGNPGILAMPDVPEPTSYALTKNFYIRAADIANKVLKMLGIDNFNLYKDIPEPNPHDVPGEWFKGPLKKSLMWILIR